MGEYNLEGVPPSLLTVGNPKTQKGESHGYLTAILHLAPHKLSGVANVCAYASHGCSDACLNTAGRGGFGVEKNGDLNVVQAARIRRTRYFKSNKGEFMKQLVAEITKHIEVAERNSLLPAIRLNGTSDIPWENIKVPSWPQKNIMDIFSGTQFYDYTKFPIKLRKKALDQENYHLSFSLSESNDNTAAEALMFGVNVVTVFDTKKGRPLPAEFMKKPVIDGDVSDLRFLDPSGVIVGLRAKGKKGKADTTGFVRSVNEQLSI